MKLKLKMKNLLVTLGVAALATMNVMAADALLSPRAAEQQIKSPVAYNNDPNLVVVLSSVTPHVHDTAIITAAGKDTAVTPASICIRRMAGSPKIVGACADHPGSPMACCSADAPK